MEFSVKFQIYFGLTVVLLSTVCSSNNVICNNETMNCLDTLRKLMEEDYIISKEDKDEKNKFCEKFEFEGDCMKNVTDICKKGQESKVVLGTGIHNHLIHQCSPGRETRKSNMDILLCIERHRYNFLECLYVSKSDEDKSLERACMSIGSMLCVADKGRKFCEEDGKSAAENIEYGLKEPYSMFCKSASVSLNCNFYVIFLTSILLLMVNIEKTVARAYELG
ncbi:hypothetical protein JTE90_011942 [Oedothorax gibbosus]|uniref:Uncharacterized protein n=1 Tax=Oedothorax gibbosus TaxID=931172 RepID=A0AAV6V0Q8_9ARAC|nr:hypothetical protein JTE90_011942 [Oedothorax gibbosus]